jgi:hypothetical protein
MQGMTVSGARCLSHVHLFDTLHGPTVGSMLLPSLNIMRLRSRCENHFTFFEAAFGAHLGAYGVPVNWHFTAEYPLRTAGLAPWWFMQTFVHT